MATHTHADGTVHDGPAHEFTEAPTQVGLPGQTVSYTATTPDTRHTLGKGRIRGLQDRLNANQQTKRGAKIQARATVADQLTRQAGRTLGYAYALGVVVKRQERWLVLLSVIVASLLVATSYLFVQLAQLS